MAEKVGSQNNPDDKMFDQEPGQEPGQEYLNNAPGENGDGNVQYGIWALSRGGSKGNVEGLLTIWKLSF